MSIKVYMAPPPDKLGESGILRVIQAYRKYLPDYGFKFVNTDTTADLITSHAASYPSPQICHCHGLYWSGDFPDAEHWQWYTNAHIIAAIRQAKAVTVPSEWVAETFRREMRFNPVVVPHGIEWQEWQHKEECRNYVLWNKNRSGVDVCDNSILIDLMKKFPKVPFLSTFAPRGLDPSRMGDWPKNLKVTEGGVIPHHRMKRMVQRAGVYLSTTKETFCVGVLEAMASGKPILGYDYGGNSILVKHGVNGYLAKPNSKEDLFNGLDFCFRYAKTLGMNSMEIVKEWTWEKPIQQIAEIYKQALENDYKNRPISIDLSLDEF